MWHCAVLGLQGQVVCLVPLVGRSCSGPCPRVAGEPFLKRPIAPYLARQLRGGPAFTALSGGEAALQWRRSRDEQTGVCRPPTTASSSSRAEPLVRPGWRSGVPLPSAPQHEPELRRLLWLLPSRRPGAATIYCLLHSDAFSYQHVE